LVPLRLSLEGVLTLEAHSAILVVLTDLVDDAALLEG
jgi:hypothetical protein